MKLLPKNQINDKLNAEKKSIIDSGVFIAKKIDALREEMLTLQKERDEFIANSQQVINDSLSELQQKKDSLSKEIKELEAKRKELLKPLDDKWSEVRQVELRVLADRETNRLDRQQINSDEKELKEKEKSISGILANARWKEQEVEKARNETFSLRDLAQKEYETAKSNREVSERESETKLSELYTKIATYENGIALYENKEKDLAQREVALLSERKHLESQQRQLRKARKIIQNGN